MRIKMKLDALKQLARFQRDVRLYLIGLAITLFSSSIPGVLLNLLLLRLGYGPEFVGLVSGLRAFTYAVACLVSGVLARWLGLRRMILLGFALASLSLLLVGFGQWVPLGLRSGWLVTATLISGAAFAMCYSNGIPFIMRAISPDQRDYAFAIRSGLRPLMGFLGGIVGGLLPAAFGSLLTRSLDHPTPYSLSFLLAGAVSAPALVVMLATHRIGVWDGEAARSRAGGGSWMLIGLVTLFSMLHAGGQRLATTFFNVYLDAAHGIATAQIGVLIALAQLAAAPAAMAFPAMAKRIGTYRTVVIATLGTAAAMVLMALVPHWTAAAVGLVGATALEILVMTASVVYSQQLVTPAWQSVMSGSLTMGLGLGVTASSLAGGYVIKALGYRQLFGAGAVAIAIAAGLFWSTFRLPRGELAQQLAEPVPTAAGAKPAGTEG